MFKLEHGAMRVTQRTCERISDANRSLRPAAYCEPVDPMQAIWTAYREVDAELRDVPGR
jgi:hypothetical protein